MLSMDWQRILVGALAGILAPVIILLWKRLAPPRSHSEFDHLGVDTLKKRNGALDLLFTLLMFAGLMAPLFLMLALKIKPTAPKVLIGLGCLSFGLMVLLPVGVIAAITLPHGQSRFREFWRFYETKWGIGLNGITWVYAPIAALVPVGLIFIVSGI
jgi:hypothetical protein